MIPSNLKRSVSNLWAWYGRTESVAIGLVINTAVALLGLVVWQLTSGLWAALGIAWFLLNIFPVVDAVLRDRGVDA